MLKIKALNQESSSDEDVPSIGREAQEEVVLEHYNKALRAIASKSYVESEDTLRQLIEKNIPELENNGGLPKSMSTLKYSCYVNLGNIHLKQNNTFKALEALTQASDLDPTDVTLWCKIGKLAITVNQFRKASYAFSKGLECNESHWPCLDNLISVLYALKDTVACLLYIGKALMLDPDYTKGLILRRQIYRDNPATKEYYQLYNPDYIWEPPLNIEIEEEDERVVLKEAHNLCNQVIEAEKNLESQICKTIPLPKSLNDYSWVSLAETVVFCHQYITDNGMSHFTSFDISKCMSQNTESVHSVYSEKSDEHDDKEKKTVETKFSDQGAENGSEKMDIETVTVERRFSQNSENTNGHDNMDNITPVQTDNDEEQNMEAENDNETDGDNGETSQRRRGKGTKRKRDVLSDLQIWGWHSKRKPPKKITKDFTVEDALNRIIPKSLLKNKITPEILCQGGEDSMNTMDIYNMYVQDKELNFLSPIHSPKSVNYEAYFNTDREKEDVMRFWTKERTRLDAIVLVKELTLELSNLWQYQWPKKLIPLYIQVFKMFREHVDQPQVFCNTLTFEEMKNDAMATLLYGELITFTENTETLHPTQLGYLQIISNWSDKWQDAFTSVFIRFQWLQAHIFRKTHQNDLAIRSLQLTLEEIEEKETNCSERFSLNLPNFSKYGFITKQIVEKIINHLNMIISLTNVETLFNSQNYQEVIDILKQTFGSGSYSKVGRMGRPAQLGILLHSLWYTDWGECFVWTEECLNEALQNYGKLNADHEKWEKIIEKCLGIFHEIIKKETFSIIDKLSEDNRCRLVDGLSRIVCIQLNTEGSVIPFNSVAPWIILHYVLSREEYRQYATNKHNHHKRGKIETNGVSPDSSDHELPPSIAILFSAHEFLGPKGWCLTAQGELLHFILDTVLDRLDTPVFEPVRDKIEVHIEQGLFCLYLYPSKKTKMSRHLVDHNVGPLQLTWERSFQLYQYYAPECLPEFNSFKNASISADLEQLFKRILALIPFRCDLHTHLPKVMNFIYGKADKVPEPMDFPNKIRAIYYLLGDFYFKEKAFNRCIKYFQLDLCINPQRLDTWACLALSYTAQLESILNFCEKLKNESDFLDKAKSAQICFRKALELKDDDCVLWIERGAFEYMVHSFCSRLIKYESENFSMEKFELLESEKESYLDSSRKSLRSAINLFDPEKSQNEQDERWLQYYILGKIEEKKRKEPSVYLNYYLEATSLLNENKATYPEKINYNNPQYLSVEALELNYRVHASILKYLELHEDKEIPTTIGAFFKKCVASATKHYIVQAPSIAQASKITEANCNVNVGLQETKSVETSETNKTQAMPCSESELIVQQCLEDVLSKVDEIVTGKETENAQEPEKLIEDDVAIVNKEQDDVIMISDSEDEDCKDPETEAVAKEKQQGVSELEDVQFLLDQMMEQTMKNVEKYHDPDANNSGTEQVEEAVDNEESLKMHVDPMSDNNGTMIVDEQVEKETQPKEKPSDSETDTDNRRADDDSSTSSTTSSSSSSSDSDSDDSDSGSTTSSEEASGNMSNSEILQLVDKCVNGLEMCVTRLPQNYKALYRLAHLFFNYKGRKDYTKCKQLLLGEYVCKDGTVVNGLFSDRKANNFFNNIWRIPSTEIDRPGSLAAHMNRCISLLLQVLRNTNDNKTLMEICMQLRKTPDRDKIYIKESDRDVFSDQAMNMCIQSLRAQIKNIDNMKSQQVVKLLLDIHRIYQKVQKNAPNKESIFSGMLVDVYKKSIKETLPENVNVLDMAVKFCQQNRPGDKPKSQTSTPSVSFVRNPGMATPPVHPAPGSVSNSPKMMKPPSLGRPRGRPPLPKVPGKIRVPRAKSPSHMGIGSYNWPPMFESNLAYIKHYQDQLIKQYSQGSTFAQLTQLIQAMSKGQLTNPTITQALTNQFLSPAGLLPPNPNLVSKSNVLPALDPNQGLFKSFTQQVPPVSLSGLSPEQVKFLEMMLPKSQSPYKATTSTVTAPAPAAVTKPKQTMSTKTTSSQYMPLDPQKPKVKSATTLFKEPSPTKALTSATCASEGKSSGGVFMKDRPNISITPVANISSTAAFIAPNTSPKSVYSKPPTTANSHAPKHTYSTTASGLSKTSVSSSVLGKAPYITAPLSYSSTAKQAPAAHSSTNVKLNHALPITPPPVSSPSFVKHASSGSPGKTLQEKLADKKKEQLLKNVEAKELSNNLLKNLNIPSALSVSPAMPNLPVRAVPGPSYTPAISKPPTFSSGYSSSKNVVSTFPADHKLPSALTVSKTSTQVPPPKFYPESGISITQPQKAPQPPRKPYIWNPSF
ncbi:calcineurin-binding protein cabin-1-like isoform X2 [Rhynchophorus ferrugineus]|uniref:calcineurin-binding protein cabin-1-like isoform X2 n=1 Tax=Rhynchophorus ferrugineus TaxID=354439 RepID=UPI003FCD8C02